jgi:hypothetical protein
MPLAKGVNMTVARANGLPSNVTVPVTGAVAGRSLLPHPHMKQANGTITTKAWGDVCMFFTFNQRDI